MSNLVHVAYTTLMRVDRLGNVVDRMALGTADTDVRVIADATVSNSLGNPTVASYLALEAAQGFVPSHIDQTVIITYKV